MNPSLQEKLDKLEQTLEQRVIDKLEGIIDTTVNFSPVDTGSYVQSHSLDNGSGTNTRSNSSINKPKGRDIKAEKAKSKATLLDDLNRTDVAGSEYLILRNSSEHATKVEHKHGHKVFAKTKNLYR